MTSIIQMNALILQIAIAKAVHKKFVEREAIRGVRSRLAFRMRKAAEWNQRERQLRADDLLKQSK